MNSFLGGARVHWHRIAFLLTAVAVAAGITIGLTVWSAGEAAAETVPSGARVVTVNPVFGLDPNISRHHLDHAFTITDPAKVARIAAIINGLAPFPIGELSCTRGNDAAMRLTFKASLDGPVLATVRATYTGCSGVSRTDGPDTRLRQDYTSSGQQVQQLVLAIAGVRWPYTPDVLPPLQVGTAS